MKKLLSLLLAFSCIATVGCSSSDGSEEAIEIDPEDTTGYIFYDEENGAYYIDENGSHVDLVDEEATTNTKYTGLYEGDDITFQTPDGWYVDTSYTSVIVLYAEDDENQYNPIQISTFSDMGITYYDEINEESLTEDYVQATEDGNYTSFEFVSCEETTIKDCDTLEYVCNVTLQSDDDNTDGNTINVQMANVIIDDDAAGHCITVTDTLSDDSGNDDIDATAALDELLESISFT